LRWLVIMVQIFGKFIPADLNDGHMEYLHFTLGGIMIVTGLAYVVVMNKMQLGITPSVGKGKEEEAKRSAV
jgi:peptide/histidine transporter 3/4